LQTRGGASEAHPQSSVALSGKLRIWPGPTVPLAGISRRTWGNTVVVAQVAPDDVKPLVERMIALLRQPEPRSRRQRIAGWFTGGNGAAWRRDALAYFSDLRTRLDDPTATFEDDGHHLVRWLDWDLGLERQPEEIRHLAPRIQHALELLERSRTRRT
jgi:hypothetical protein